MSKLIPPITIFHPPVLSSPQILTYTGDGDSRGLFHFFGTNFRRKGWENPETAGRLVLITTPNIPGPSGDLPETIVDRAISNYSTDPSFPFVTFDLGVGRALVIDYYSFRYRNNFGVTPGDYSPTAWTVAGSNDDSDYTHVVDTVSGEATTPLNRWVSRSIMGETLSYRYWKITMTGLNTGGTTHFALGEFELYGNFTF